MATKKKKAFKVVGAYDAGSKYGDRYTIVSDKTSGFTRIDGKMAVKHECLLLSSDCNMPNGVNMWGECVIGEHLGQKIKLTQLPKRVRKCLEVRRA